MSGVSAGHETRVVYYYEDAGFDADPNDTTAKAFGPETQVGTTEGRNALERVFMPSQRTAIDLLAMVYDGEVNVDFNLENPWWIKSLLGDYTKSDNGDGTFTYEFTGDSPLTLQIVEGHEQSGKERVISGVMITEATIDVAVEDRANVSLRGAYANEEIVDPASLTAQAMPEYDPMTFAEGSVSIDGSTESYVQSASMTITSTIDPIRELGTRIAIDYNPKVLEPDVTLEKLFDGDHSSLEELFGGTGSTAPQEDADENQVAFDLTFDNAKAAGSGMNKGTLTLTGTLPESYDESGMGDPRADLQETVNRFGQAFEATWTNEVDK